MRSTRRRERPHAALLLLTALFFLFACRDTYPRPRFRGAGAQTPRHGGTLRWAVETDVRSLDPHLAYDEYSTSAVHEVFDTLVDYAPGTATISPSLAERWETSADGTVFTFHLRPGVRFHNGRVLVADDVRQSFERMLDPAQIPCPATSFYHLIAGFEDYQEHRAPHVAGIEVLDPLTVRFRLTQPDQTFLSAMAMSFAAPVPMESVRAAGRDGFAQAPVGTGPFIVERWELGSRIVLRRNPSYWRSGLPYLDRILMETGVARHLQFMRFQRGDIEYVHSGSIITADHVWVHEQPAWRPYVIDSPDISIYGVMMNVEIPPWNNVHLRRAVAYAIDRDAMCRSRNHRISAIGGLYPPGLPGYDPHLPNAQHYDVARAQQEISLAGYAHGLPGEHELWVGDGDGFGQLIQADLARIGVHVRLRQASFAVFLENTSRRGAVALAIGAWSQDFPDPSNFIDTLFHSRSIQPEGSQNGSFYANPRLDALLDRARVELDHPRRIAMYQQAEQMVVDDAPWAFMAYPVRTEVLQPYVRDFHPSPVWQHDFRNVWLDLPLHRVAAREKSAPAHWNGLAALALPRRAW